VESEEHSHHQAGRDMGTGLGLSLVRDSIQKHGGEITVHSGPGEGSRFRITLPAAVTMRGEAHASG